MTTIAREVVEAYVRQGVEGRTTADQGRALEDLICYIFSQVPGVAVTRRNEKNAFLTEEIDVALWNDGATEGFFPTLS